MFDSLRKAASAPAEANTWHRTWEGRLPRFVTITRKHAGAPTPSGQSVPSGSPSPKRIGASGRSWRAIRIAAAAIATRSRMERTVLVLVRVPGRGVMDGRYRAVGFRRNGA